MGATIYVVLTVSAAFVYPGGTVYDHARVGFALDDNYLCDLNRAVAIGGLPNGLGSVLSQVATVVLIVAITGAFAMVGSLFPDRPTLGRIVRAFGLVSGVAMLAVPLSPSHRWGRVHFVIVGLAAIPSLFALVLASIGMLRRGRAHAHVSGPARALVAAAVIVSVIHFGQYVSRAVFHAEDTPSLARLQKLAALLDVAWVVLVARLVRNAARGRRAPGALSERVR